jgi:hypothetical protein
LAEKTSIHSGSLCFWHGAQAWRTLEAKTAKAVIDADVPHFLPASAESGLPQLRCQDAWGNPPF